MNESSFLDSGGVSPKKLTAFTIVALSKYSITWVAIVSPALSCASTVDPAICGVRSKRLFSRIRELRIGSCSKTSRAAPAKRSFSSWSRRSDSNIRPPRAVLMRKEEFFIKVRVFLQTIPFVFLLRGKCRLKKSLFLKTEFRCSRVTLCSDA